MNMYELVKVEDGGIRCLQRDGRRYMARIKLPARMAEAAFASFMDPRRLKACHGVFDQVDLAGRIDDCHDVLNAQFVLLGRFLTSPCQLSRYFFRTDEGMFCVFCSVITGHYKIPFGAFVVRRDGLISLEMEINWGNIPSWIGNWFLMSGLVNTLRGLRNHLDIEADEIDSFSWPSSSSSSSGSITRRIAPRPVLANHHRPVASTEQNGKDNDDNNDDNDEQEEDRVYDFGPSEVTHVPSPEYSPTDVSVWWDRGALDGVFMVRGPNYLTDRIKVPASTSLMEPLDFVLRFTREPTKRVTSEAWFQEQHNRPNRPFLFITNFVLPDFGNWITFWVRRQDIPRDEVFERMLMEYMEGDDAFRDHRLKLIPGIAKGSFIAKSAVGNKPGIIGTKMKTLYYKGENCFEVVVDVSSSTTASSLMKVVAGFASGLDLEFAFLFESKTADELPERILGGIGVHQPNMTPPWHR